MAISYKTNLNDVTPSDIETYNDFHILVDLVRLNIDSNRNVEFIKEYYDFISFLLTEYPIVEEHYTYFATKSGISPTGDIETSAQNSCNKFILYMDEDNKVHFNVEYKFRVILTSLYRENLPKEVQFTEERLSELVERFWYFVDYGQKQTPSVVF
ncbi:hypothetical protein [Parvicella tangerina]|uniref:Uncharacterized protein n=1 Tax=Parvicella tangerina TaxID=2829795 RepID=A0A916NDK3_9FLAO|nr:hypothetical protein [Parvicella tangerina]CAG5086855.1 hypothetical protein CRYO30217_03308 [Parvicella tangerina]